MCNDREPYSFKRCMFFAKCDIKRVWKAYFFPKQSELEKDMWGEQKQERCGWKYLPHEFKCIIMEIKHGVFDQGK